MRNKEILFRLKKEIYYLYFFCREIQSLREQVSNSSITTSLRDSYEDYFSFVTRKIELNRPKQESQKTTCTESSYTSDFNTKRDD